VNAVTFDMSRGTAKRGPTSETWRIVARVGGFATHLVHANGAELERVESQRWQLTFGGQHRTFTGRHAPVVRADRELEELRKKVLGGGR
jgi:hypothetical protein